MALRNCLPRPPVDSSGVNPHRAEQVRRSHGTFANNRCAASSRSARYRLTWSWSTDSHHRTRPPGPAAGPRSLRAKGQPISVEADHPRGPKALPTAARPGSPPSSYHPADAAHPFSLPASVSLHAAVLMLPFHASPRSQCVRGRTPVRGVVCGMSSHSVHVTVWLYLCLQFGPSRQRSFHPLPSGSRLVARRMPGGKL